MSFKLFALATILGLAQAKPAPTVLEHDDILLLRSDGPPTVMKSWEYQIEEDKREVQRRKANLPRVPAPSVKARGCEESTEVQITSDTSFNDWDVAMSPVVSNTGSSAASVAVTQGYSLSNSLSVSATVGVELEGILSESLTVDSTESWETSDSQTFTFNVPDGQYGVVVSNPWVRRILGNVLSGCTDSPTSDGFMSDTYTSETYGGMSWVTGPIGLCNSSSYPVPFCVGTGSHE